MELGVGMFGDNHYDKNGKALPVGVRLQELIEEITILAQEKERNELGLELHDNIN